MSEPHANPCPFCKFQPEVDDGDFCYPNNRTYTDWSCKCYGGCNAEGPWARTRALAIAAWNGDVSGAGYKTPLPVTEQAELVKRVKKRMFDEK